VLVGHAAVDAGDESAARTALQAAEGIADDPELLYQAGSLSLSLGELELATSYFAEAVEIDPDMADAVYGLGLAHGLGGNRPEQIRYFLRTLALDESEPPPPWGLSEDEFADLAEAALAELPDDAITRLENVPVLIEPAPDPDLVADGVDPRLLGLFSGIPLPEKSNEGQAPVLDSVHLYQRNLERHCRDRDELVAEIRITVLHETAHFFGLDDHDLDGMGLG
jgi:predicted Zn-dependent protease with MMP-like domain